MPAKAPQFRKRTDEEKRSVSMLIRWTPAEADAVKASAKRRSLEIAEFVRRATLGRRAEHDDVTELVLQLSDMTRSIRAMHKDMMAGKPLPESELRDVLLRARNAIVRIGT